MVSISRRLGGVSQLASLRQSGSFRVLFPRDDSGVSAVLLNTAGGVTGGDRFKVKAEAGAGSRLSVTTQAAERIYRALPESVGEVANTLRVAGGAQLHWLPQETILFDGCALSRRLEVDLAASARFVMVEPVCFGRGASGEVIEHGYFSDRVTIRRAGQQIYRDGVMLSGAIDQQLSRPAVAAGGRAMASIVCVGPEAEACLGAARAIMGRFGGVSLLTPDVLVGRIVAEDAYVLRQSLVPLLNLLTNDQLPKCWRL